MIGANDLNPVFVEFANKDSQMLDRLRKIYETLTLESRRVSNITIPFEQAKSRLQEMPEYKKFREELLENFYWKPADYQIELSIGHSDNKTEIYRCEFSLNEGEVSELKENIDASMLGEISRLYQQPANFTVLYKDFTPMEE